MSKVRPIVLTSPPTHRTRITIFQPMPRCRSCSGRQSGCDRFEQTLDEAPFDSPFDIAHRQVAVIQLTVVEPTARHFLDEVFRAARELVRTWRAADSQQSASMRIPASRDLGFGPGYRYCISLTSEPASA